MNICIFTCFHTGVKGRSRVERMFWMLPVCPHVASSFYQRSSLLLSVTISLIKTEGGAGGMDRGGAPPETGRRRGVVDKSSQQHHPPQTPLAPSVLSLTLPHLSSIPSFISPPQSVSLRPNLPLPGGRQWNTPPLCLSITPTAEAIITFHSSIRGSQLWSISTLSPLHSTTLNLKCLPSVSVSTYLPADKAILDSGAITIDFTVHLCVCWRCDCAHLWQLPEFEIQKLWSLFGQHQHISDGITVVCFRCKDVN